AAVVLNNELFADRVIDVRAIRRAQHLTTERRRIPAEPLRHRPVADGLPQLFEVRAAATALAKLDAIAGLHNGRRDRRPAPVDVEVPVLDELPGLRPRLCETETVNNVVEPLLQDAQQVLTRQAGALQRLPEVAAELPLKHAIDPAHLLLLAKLARVVRGAAAAILRLAALRARRIIPLLNAAVRGQAARSLQEQLLTLPAADLTLWSGISCHVSRASSFSRCECWIWQPGRICRHRSLHTLTLPPDGCSVNNQTHSVVKVQRQN